MRMQPILLSILSCMATELKSFVSLQLVKEFLSQAFPLPQLFLALDEATRQNNRERVGQASKAILRVFTSSIGPALLDDPVVLPNLNAGEYGLTGGTGCRTVADACLVLCMRRPPAS